MTSGHFHSVELASIRWQDRQRRDLGDIDELADSLNRLGQIHPIVITREHVGIAGERRWTAAKRLGWTHIAAQYQDETDELILHCIELEENIKRVDLPWQDRVRSIARYHELRKQADPAWTYADTAGQIGESVMNVSRHITVAAELSNPEVARADKLSTAVNRANAARERRRADDAIHIVTNRDDTHQILTADFNAWAPVYDGPKFNFIHCDFPYGINAHQHAGQNSALQVEYKDTAEAYWTLFKTLSVHLDRFCAPSAHIIFWFSPNVYCQTWEMLKLLDGFKFEEHPLIWQRGENEGIAPDPQRRPRRIYETAFFGWRNDRKIIQIKANSIVAPTERERHPHEKSEPALQHFFSMVVDSGTRLLDPTCGSGSALRAAKSLGASASLGLERDEHYARVAREALATVG